MSIPLTHDVPAVAAAFIAAHLPLTTIPRVPELRLHLAGPESGLRRLAEMDADSVTTPFWAFCWAGGLALARYVLDHRDIVAGRRVLDLGTGSGLVAIAAAKAGARRVHAADIDLYALEAVRLNAAANEAEIETIFGDLTTGPPTAADVVLVGDLFYDKTLAERVADFLTRCRAAGVAVLIGDPFRAYLPRARLTAIAEYDVADFGGGGTPEQTGVFLFDAG